MTNFFNALPPFKEENPSKYLKSLYGWLYQLSENLNFLFSDLDEASLANAQQANILQQRLNTLSQQTDTRFSELAQQSEISLPETGIIGPYPLTLSGYALPYTTGQNPFYFKLNGIVFIYGCVKLNTQIGSTSTRHLADVPEGFRPRYTVSFPTACERNWANVTMNTSGYAMIQNTGNNNLSTTASIHFSMWYLAADA